MSNFNFHSFFTLFNLETKALEFSIEANNTVIYTLHSILGLYFKCHDYSNGNYNLDEHLIEFINYGCKLFSCGFIPELYEIFIEEKYISILSNHLSESDMIFRISLNISKNLLIIFHKYELDNLSMMCQKFCLPENVEYIMKLIDRIRNI